MWFQNIDVILSQSKDSARSPPYVMICTNINLELVMEKNELIYGCHALEAALKVHPEIVKHVFVWDAEQDRRRQKIVALAEQKNINVTRVKRHKLNTLVGHQNHQGLVGICQTRISYDETHLLDLISDTEKPTLLLILDGVQDPRNLGACIRTANAFGVDAIIAPKDRAVGITPVVRKAASGAVEITPFIQVTNLARTLRNLKNASIWLIGTADNAETLISDIDFTGNVGIVLGGEGKGLRRLTRQHCDFMARISMFGTVSNLNVSVAAGVLLYEAVRQRFLPAKAY